MEQIEFLKREIVEKSRRAYESKLFAGTSGNMSAFLMEEGKLVITPSGVRYETMTPEDVMVIGLDGTIFEGPHKPSSEWRMHAAVYAGMPGVNAVFHTHSPYATAFAVNHMAIPAALIEMDIFLGGQVECAGYATPGTPEVGTGALPALAGKGGCLLANHGVLAIGADLHEAYLRAEYIEDAAKIYCIAKGLGTPVLLNG